MAEEKKTIERINDKMVKVDIKIENVMSNQELYNLFAGLKQQEIQYSQQARKIEHNLEKVRKEIAFLDKIARDCESRIPKNEEA